MVKSAFSIFKENMSSGITIKAEGNITPTQPTKPNNPTCNDTITIDNSTILKTNESTIYTDSIKVMSGSTDISAKVSAEAGKPQKWDAIQHKYVTIDKIDRKDVGTYKIAYTITYNDCEYNVDHQITIQ